MESKRATWSGQLAFVLAAAASAIGLGNLWRFPYLAAQYGGGTFIVIYLGLVVTLGFTLMLTEISIGRITRQSPLTAYSRLDRRWGWLGWLGTLVSFLILPYYCVIGGWVLKYLKVFAAEAFAGAAPLADPAAYFDGFLTASTGLAAWGPYLFGLVFVVGTAGVILLGVKNGIEKSNLVMMPILFLMAAAIAVYVVCLPGSGAGLGYYLLPNMDSLCDASGRFSLAVLGKTVLGAMGQMFYSLSLAMGIMITYGSYMRREDAVEASVRRIEIFDTLVAVIAGLMIVPTVYLFAVKTGVDVKGALQAGPGLMFKTLPLIFSGFGAAGAWLGFAFFLLVTFAALTSAISMMEACVASVCDRTGLSRRAATCAVGTWTAVMAFPSATGSGLLASVTLAGMTCLDFFDFITNSVIMPVVAAGTCVFVGWVMGPKPIIDEVERGGRVFRAKPLYVLMVKYMAPLLVTAILVSEVCRAFGVRGWKI